ncbi:MAG: hypothetical protein ACREU2_09510 [Steroidobacteraceae bacterium]
MPKTLPKSDQTLIEHAVRGLTEFSATELASETSSITRAVFREGAAVITKHQRPVMVLLSVERYAQLERAGSPRLGTLSQRFEELYARMQEPVVAERTLGALDLSRGPIKQQAEPAQHSGTPAARRGG